MELLTILYCKKGTVNSTTGAEDIIISIAIDKPRHDANKLRDLLQNSWFRHNIRPLFFPLSLFFEVFVFSQV